MKTTKQTFNICTGKGKICVPFTVSICLYSVDHRREHKNPGCPGKGLITLHFVSQRKHVSLSTVHSRT